MKTSYTTLLVKDAEKNATGIPVPQEVVAALGSGKRPAVIVTVNGYSYRSTVAAYGDVYMLPLSQEHRTAAGVKAGDQIEVTLELDTAPRTVEIPEDLKAALNEHPGVLAAFESLAFSKRKEFVRQVEDAKTAETRTRRIAKIVTEMNAK